MVLESKFQSVKLLAIGQNIQNEYPIVETFYSVQGEGFWTGTPAFFIRLAGCDVGCSWCDTKKSWNMKHQSVVNVQALVSEVIKHGVKRCIITGGEPLMHNLDSLTSELQKNDIKTHLETSGVYPLSGTWDWITLSPKQHKLPASDIWQYCNELKIVVLSELDFKWIESIPKSQMHHLYLQPEWDKIKSIMPFIYAYVMKHPEWKISLQIHKFIGIF